MNPCIRLISVFGMKGKSKHTSFCMQLVLYDDSTVYYIKFHLRFFFFLLQKHDFKEHCFKMVRYLFYHKDISKVNIWEGFVPSTRVLGSGLERVSLFIFLLTISLGRLPRHQLKNSSPITFPHLRHSHFPLVVVRSWGLLENIQIWPVIYTVQ